MMLAMFFTMFVISLINALVAVSNDKKGLFAVWTMSTMLWGFAGAKELSSLIKSVSCVG